MQASHIMGYWRSHLTACWPHFSARGKAGVEERENEVAKSPEDERNYRCLELTNGLKVLLVSDPLSEKAAVSLDIRVGHMCDPPYLPGLAHLCEHMLFMSSSKCEVSGDYQQFISQHAGSSNAYTSQDHTNYHLDIAQDHFVEALKRFSQFFLQPVFTRSAMEAEINAVNAENEKNITHDQWRLFQLGKSTARPGHAYCKFGTGNKSSLETQPKKQGIDTYRELVKFHRQHYSSNLMALAILGKESLDELEALVISLFSRLPNKRSTLPYWPEHPYGPNQVKVSLHVVPVKDMQNLLITWPIPDIMPQYKVKPGHYLSHVIGHQGPGSLLSLLKQKGWVNLLVAAQKIGASGFMFFCISLDLSNEGFDNITEIVAIIFQYLNMLRACGPVERIYMECRELKNLRFRFKDKERPRDYVSDYAELIHYFPLKDVLTAPWLMEDFDGSMITSLLEKLTVDNIRLVIRSKKYIGQTNLRERWYGTEYYIQDISESRLQVWRNAGCHALLHLPPRNEFIPRDFSLATPDLISDPMPRLVMVTPLMDVWFRQDLSYQLPKTCVTLSLTSPCAYMSIDHGVHCEMTCQLLRDGLQEFTCPAHLAGLVYDIYSTPHGITLTFHGYTDTLHTLVYKVLHEVVNHKVHPHRLDTLKEKYRRSLSNLPSEPPHQQTAYHVNHLSSDRFWTKEQLLAALPGVTASSTESFLHSMLQRIHVEMLVYGSTTCKDTMEYAYMVKQTLEQGQTLEPLQDCQSFRLCELKLPDGSHFVYRRENSVHQSGAVMLYFQCGIQETRQNMLLELLAQLLHQHCYDTLRTTEQLGYIVISGVRRAKGVQGWRVTIQTDYPTEYVEHRVHMLLANCQPYLYNMPDDVFNNHLRALASSRLERPKSLIGQNAKYWTEISSNLYNFDRDIIEVDYLRTLKKDDILTFYEEYLKPGAVKRHVLSMHVMPTSCNRCLRGDQNTQLSDHSMKTAEEISDVAHFKEGLSFYPPPRPAPRTWSASPPQPKAHP